MKEHGLLLSAPMVRALGKGMKTQTRRAVTFYNSTIEKFDGWTKRQVWDMLDFDRAKIHADGKLMVPFKPGVTTLRVAIEVRPRIQPHDVIWWKETYNWMHTDSLRGYPDLQDGRPIEHGDPETEEYHIRVAVYRATEPNMSLSIDDEHGDLKNAPWQPSIFMPREAARYTSSVLRVRPELLRDISPADAIAEGLTQLSKDNGRTWKWGIPDSDGWPGNDDDGWHWHLWRQNPVEAYGKLWRDINGLKSWQQNPLVWVIEFGKHTA